jgi:hypothetical protein
MKMNHILISFAAAIVLAGCANRQKNAPSTADFEENVRMAVNYQLKLHPLSTLRDFYKSFFQDKFGPGHLIPDTAMAGDYLRREMAAYDNPTAVQAQVEKTGWEGRFRRVDLDVVKSGLVPYELFLKAFCRSAAEVEAPTLEEWKQEWAQIEAIIRQMNLPLKDYEADLADINRNLQAGIYMGHHSEAFEKAYSPHYRIIKKEIFEELILPLL